MSLTAVITINAILGSIVVYAIVSLLAHGIHRGRIAQLHQRNAQFRDTRDPERRLAA